MFNHPTFHSDNEDNETVDNDGYVAEDDECDNPVLPGQPGYGEYCNQMFCNAQLTFRCVWLFVTQHAQKWLRMFAEFFEILNKIVTKTGMKIFISLAFCSCTFCFCVTKPVNVKSKR